MASRASRWASSVRQTWSPGCSGDRSQTRAKSALASPRWSWSSSPLAAGTLPRCACRTWCSRTRPERRCHAPGLQVCPCTPTRGAQMGVGPP